MKLKSVINYHSNSEYFIANALSHNPTPKMICVTILLILACVGLGVFDEAIPKPREGCKINSGNITVQIP
jgi:hypothetical protein